MKGSADRVRYGCQVDQPDRKDFFWTNACVSVCTHAFVCAQAHTHTEGFQAPSSFVGESTVMKERFYSVCKIKIQ